MAWVPGQSPAPYLLCDHGQVPSPGCSLGNSVEKLVQLSPSQLAYKEQRRDSNPEL